MESQRGQASVELLGVLPAALLAVAVAWQLVVAGHATWMVGNAARVGARAAAVGDDPRSAARSALPDYLERRLQVRRRDDRVVVRVRLPTIVRAWDTPFWLRGSAALRTQE
jgi:hypothetical protein